jgi:protein-S-isoprenylcysteine O-methyltransferase Ste14
MMVNDRTTRVGLPDAPQDLVVRLGGWLFKQRSWLPLPIAVALLILPASSRPTLLLWAGVVVVAAGESLRLWAVHHIGVVSRTRSQRLGPLIVTGPFGHVRNPLYLGNIALWIGFTLSAGLAWLAPIVLTLLVIEYHAIVRWEEELLVDRLGDPYRSYLALVPRWIPSFPGVRSEQRGGLGSWRDTLYSERSTLIAVGLGYVILGLKA